MGRRLEHPVENALAPGVLAELTAIVGAEFVTVDARQLTSGSRDCYHFSPVLTPKLEGRSASAIVWPQSQQQLRDVIALAVRHRVPLVPRGAGTGNYGQGVPLQGGLLVNTKGLNRIMELTPEYARVEAGVVLYDIEKAAAPLGAELRIFPSTVPTSSSGGFITGGSGGVGSIEWGMLWEADNVRAATIYTMEAQPRRIEMPRADLEGVLHNCGLTAVVADVTFALAPRTRWHQYVLSFPDLDLALSAAQSLAGSSALRRRLVTAFEWPLPSFFKPLVRRGACREGAAAVFLYADADPAVVETLAGELGGTVTFHEPPGDGIARGTQIYDYTWNHTTQWAMKADPSMTYLQDRFDNDRLHQQIAERKARFPGELIEHVEFTRSAGQVAAAGLTVVRYRSAERLQEIMAFSEAIGIRISNPHTYFLDDDRRWYGEAFLRAKARWDPLGLLNPGHLHAPAPA